MTTSTINAAINYLVATARTAWAADPTAFVFDGPTPAGVDQEFPNKIWIGADPTLDETPGFEAVTGDHAAATLSQGRSLDEQFAIACAIEHWDGGTDLAEARAAAFSYWATFENFVRGRPPVGPGDTTMGGALGTSGWSQIGGGVAMHQAQKSNGCVALITFHVSCRARLTA
jgi:hypothetical protein